MVKISEENLLYEEIYKKTQDCGRTQFVKLLQQNQIKIKQLQKENKRLNNILTEFEKWLEEELKEKTFNAFPTYDLEKQDFVNNEIHYAPVEKTYKEVLDKLQELKNKKID